MNGPLSRASSRTRRSVRRRRRCTTTPGRCSSGSCRSDRCAPRRSSGSGRPTASATTSSCTRTRPATARPGTIHTLRQQMVKPPGRPNLALADFTAPRETGLTDHVGGFVVTAGHGLEEIVAGFKAANDDYSAILASALADRLAEAFAERLHEMVRRELWGYARDEAPDQRRPHRRALPGHPPGPRLPRLPGPHREGRAVPAARGGGADRRPPDRVLRDVAGRRGQRLLLLAPASRPISGWAGSGATSSRTTPTAS